MNYNFSLIAFLFLLWFLIKVHEACSVIAKVNVRANRAWPVTNVTDAKKTSTILDRKGAALVAVTWQAVWVANRAVIPKRAVVRAKITWKANAVTVPNLATSIWMLKIFSVPLRVSVMAIHLFADRLPATPAGWLRVYLPVLMKNGRP